jgi:hypothetical protein
MDREAINFFFILNSYFLNLERAGMAHDNAPRAGEITTIAQI